MFALFDGGHTKTYAGAMTFAFFEWFAVSAAGLVGSFSFDVAAKTKRAAELLQQSDDSETTGKANGLAMTNLDAATTGGGGSASATETSNPTVALAPSEARPDDAACAHVAGHAFEPDNTPEDPELEIELRVGDQIEVLERFLDDSPDWWQGRNERTGKVGYFPANHVSPKDVAAVRAVAAEGPAAAAEGPAGVEDAPLVGAAAAVEEIAATVSAAPMFGVPAEEAPADAAGGAVAEGAPVLVAAPSAVEI